MEDKVNCPFCNKFNIAPIIYGAIVFDDINDWEKVKSGEIILGSECRPFPKPEYFCRDCHKEFGNISLENKLKFEK